MKICDDTLSTQQILSLSSANLTAATQIVRSKLIVYNEMFSYVNIFIGPLTPATKVNDTGNLLAWSVDSWNYPQLLTTSDNYSVVVQRDLTQILGAADGVFLLVIQSSLNFYSLKGLCNRVGPGVSRIKKNQIY